jgi:hypothetical protein
MSLKSWGEQNYFLSRSRSGTSGKDLIPPFTPGKELKNNTNLNIRSK